MRRIRYWLWKLFSYRSFEWERAHGRFVWEARDGRWAWYRR